MKIECILKRSGGTRAEIGGIEYHFAPQPDGAHVADVNEKGHIARFLSMPEGYAVYMPKAEPEDQSPDGDLNGDGTVDTKDERIGLVEAYKQKFGKTPHGRASLDTLRTALAQ